MGGLILYGACSGVPGVVRNVPNPARRTGTVETLTRSRKKRSFTNRDRNALKRLVKSNRRFTLQDITAKLKQVQNKDFQPENRTKGVAFGRI